MEEKNSPESIREELEDVLNIVQLLAVSLEDNEEDSHIIRSVDVIQKMIKAVIDRIGS
ncbi:hypothetical protein C804_05151 [Lachnospiraceae bacterium A4]|jgi:NTP pyrophosphatase (non-canonical NTP hydrolase)|nr:hypothetical protein C804_05151 [Lachnospiraceae bacterium A4]